MKDKVLFSVTQITDDDTGVWTVGDLDFSIHVGALDDYLRSAPIEKRNKIFAMMGTLNCIIDRYARDLLPKDQGSAGGS